MSEVKEVKEFECKLITDSGETTSKDFVAIVAQEDGNVGICYNTDALTLGIAIKMITHEYVKLMNQLEEKERAEIVDILGKEFNIDSISNLQEEAPQEEVAANE